MNCSIDQLSRVYNNNNNNKLWHQCHLNEKADQLVLFFLIGRLPDEKNDKFWKKEYLGKKYFFKIAKNQNYDVKVSWE